MIPGLRAPQAVLSDASRPTTVAAPRSGFQATLVAKTQAAQDPQGVVPARRTALSRTEAARALGRAWETVTGEKPTAETVSILTAQWSHETGNGSHMYNYNFGGIKGTSPSGTSVVQRTSEGWGAGERTIMDRFRAYPTAEDGAIDYVRLLTRRYGGAVDAARAGDPAGFVHALKERGYFTGNEAAYQRSVTRLAQEVRDELGSSFRSGGPFPLLPPEYQAPASPLGPTTGRSMEMAAAPGYVGELPLDTSLVYVRAMSEMLDRTALSIATDKEDENRQQGV